VDAEGEERPVTRDFIVSHWGPKLSFFYPSKNKDIYLAKGTDVPDVLEVQKSLKEIGYEVETTGNYDEHEIPGGSGLKG
jgi:hypothetical protein